ncbi:hypothetical protein GDO86_004291 [Hymenochirus boettgeri]|uniref:Uncharacterized protein n=1 Tax=Hymenochirus boettgeri TaxID=247094 RepID=A0A8T2K877_9PIPI|nr:hypothetical protein GDO86_004291 [Hymenochirus boettgeri]
MCSRKKIGSFCLIIYSIRQPVVEEGNNIIEFQLLLVEQVCGIALIALGIYVQIQLNHTLIMKNAASSGAPIVIIAVGVVIFLISFLGCCGALKENYCMVTTYYSKSLVYLPGFTTKQKDLPASTFIPIINSGSQFK